MHWLWRFGLSFRLTFLPFLCLSSQLCIDSFVLFDGISRHASQRYDSKIWPHSLDPTLIPRIVPGADALIHVKRLRPCACPNSGFFKQLQNFEAQHFGSVSLDAREYTRQALLDYGFEDDAINWAMDMANCHLDAALALLLTVGGK